MARLLPPNAPPSADSTAARLQALLASLPAEWTLIADRRICGEDGPRVGFVLLHPDIGVALVDLAPARPDAAVAPLVALLDDLDLGDGALPVVVVATAPDEIETIGQQLAVAFDAAPPCCVEDPRWPEKVAGLLLRAEDAAMAPISRPAAPLPVADWRPRIDLEDAIEDRPMPLRDLRRTLTFGVAAGVIAIVIVGAAVYLVPQTPAPRTTASIGVTVPTMPQRSLPPSLREADLPPPNPPPSAAPATRSPPPEKPTPSAATASPAQLEPPETRAATAAASPPTELPALRQSAPPPAPMAKRQPAATEDASKAISAKSSTKPLKKVPPPLVSSPTATVAATNPQAEHADGPPLDAGDLPPLERAPPPPHEPASARQSVDLPVGAPVPLPSPYAGVTAQGQPVMLLPPVAPPAAMPSLPALGSGGTSLVGATPDRR